MTSRFQALALAAVVVAGAVAVAVAAPADDPAMCHADGWCVTDCSPAGFQAVTEDGPCWLAQSADSGAQS